MSMEIVQFIASLLVSIFTLLGLFVIINLTLKYNKEKKKNIKILLIYSLFFLQTIILLIFAVFITINNLLNHYLSLFSLVSLVLMLFYMDRFSSMLYRSIVTKKKEIIYAFISILLIIVISLPQNHWETSSLFDENGSLLNVFSTIMIIFYTIFAHYSTIKRGIQIERRILDPLLKETYIYINRTFKISSLMVPCFIINLSIYIIPRYDSITPIIEILNLIFIFLSLITALFSMCFLSIAISLPKWLLWRFYEKYSPMWSKESSLHIKDEERDENFKEALDKLYDALFD